MLSMVCHGNLGGVQRVGLQLSHPNELSLPTLGTFWLPALFWLPSRIWVPDGPFYHPFERVEPPQTGRI